MSTSVNMQFGVPQGSILGPMLFNLYVADLQDNLPSTVTTFQYADDTTLYTSCRPVDVPHSVDELNSTLRDLSSWSSDSHLALNPVKTKAMLLSTNQMARVHSMNDYCPSLKVSDKTLERVQQTKLLGVYLHENLKWDEHVTELSKSFLSKLDYCDTVFYPLPDFLLKRLQRIQFAAASFVSGHYVKDCSDVLKLGWLSVRERRDFHLLKQVHKALYSDHWPSYLKLDTVTSVRTLRSSSATRLVIPLEHGTFQDMSASLFNNLPANLRTCSDFRIFCREVRTHILRSRSNQ
ncbi:uncharacterized protein LOC144641732 [Oculina patagonica]